MLSVVFTISCAAPASEVAQRLPPLPLARFMREELNVPFSFALIATESSHGLRVHKAATAMREAAHDLAHWSNPPATSEQGRRVFYAYAENLERHVARLQDASASRETERATESLEHIRQTCNHCHRFFRPASRISPDVAYDRYALDIGGYR